MTDAKCTCTGTSAGLNACAGCPTPWPEISGAGRIRSHPDERREMAETDMLAAETPPELTAEEARDLADDLGTQLYRAQDALAFVEECCVIAERSGRTITVADVRTWLKGAQCGRQMAAGGELAIDQPITASCSPVALETELNNPAAPCRTTQHCAYHGWCRRCAPGFAAIMSRVNVAIQRTAPDEGHWGPLYEAIGKALNNGDELLTRGGVVHAAWDGGPSVAEAAADDRRWDAQKGGE